ncbi:MAG: C40 family peptidase [Elusimicrobiota bacterium]|nr:C40 family peptidase [Elusimicrobiota bacterium]
MKTTLFALLAALLLAAGCGGGGERRRAPRPVPAKAKAVVRTARSWLPEEEAKRPPPKDCSDFVAKVFREHGLKLPRTAQDMAEEGEALASSKELRMSDLVFFSGKDAGRSIGHVGIYVNNGIFIHQANPGEGVRMESLYSDYYRKRYKTARRIIED